MMRQLNKLSASVKELLKSHPAVGKRAGAGDNKPMAAKAASAAALPPAPLPTSVSGVERIAIAVEAQDVVVSAFDRPLSLPPQTSSKTAIFESRV